MNPKPLFVLPVGASLLFSSLTFAEEKPIVPKIVGGTAVQSGEVPWTAAILDRNSSQQFCGGTLIHPEWVVTAAHCLEGESASNVSVVVGRLDLTDTGSGETIDASQIVVHENFNNSTLINDIALIRLSSPVSAVSTRATVLDSPVENTFWVPGNDSLAAGWGNTSEGGSSSDQLLKVELPIISSADCSANAADTDFHICAGGEEGKDSCQGDSGGPLYVKDSSSIYSILAGITSYGEGCARPNEFGKYTRVIQYTDWLETNSGITLQKASSGTPVVDVPSFSVYSFAGTIILLGLVLSVSSRKNRKRFP
jgi:secreted trypsin-like serine protease